jgi:hypothetical protein
MKHPRKTRLELLADRQGLRLAARLNPAASDLPHQVTERLRAARERALASRKVQTARTEAVYGMGNSLTWGRGDDEHMGWLGRLSSGLALLLLVVGMLGISEAQNELRARELAAVDLALLTDDLPPAAFADPGFLQFLQTDEL